MNILTNVIITIAIVAAYMYFSVALIVLAVIIAMFHTK